MKVGSIVHCIDNSMIEGLLKKNTDYTIREILPIGSVVYGAGLAKFRCGEVAVRLEEVRPKIVFYNILWFDMPFPINRFRELMPPDAINIEELMTVHVSLISL